MPGSRWRASDMERKLMKGAPRKAIMDMVNKSIDESSIASEASACALMTEAVSHNAR